MTKEPIASYSTLSFLLGQNNERTCHWPELRTEFGSDTFSATHIDFARIKGFQFTAFEALILTTNPQVLYGEP